MKIEVSDEVGRHLSQLAEERKLSIEELLCAMLDQYDIMRNSVTLAELAANAEKANLSTAYPVDTSERSREILNTEYADYLAQRRTS